MSGGMRTCESGRLEAARVSNHRFGMIPTEIRLFYTGTDPTMTVDNAFEKLDLVAGGLGKWEA